MIYNYGIHDVFILYLTAFTSNNALNLPEECELPTNSKCEQCSNMRIPDLERYILDLQARMSALYKELLQRASTTARVTSLLPPETNTREKLAIIATPSKHHYIL